MLSNLAITLMDVQTSAATTKGLRLISEELDDVAAEISRLLSSEAFEFVARGVTPRTTLCLGCGSEDVGRGVGGSGEVKPPCTSS